MNMLDVVERTSRMRSAQLILVVVQQYRGEQLLLYSHTLANTVFMVGNEHDAVNTMKDLFPDLLLLDMRLPENVKRTLTLYVQRHKKMDACVTPLVAQIVIDNWLALNKGAEESPIPTHLSCSLDALLTTLMVEIV